MSRSTLVAGALLALAVVVGPVGLAAGACAGDGPEIVLDCFSRAYSERSLELLESVLAPDYIWVAVSPPQVEIFEREHSVASSVKMFRSPELEDVSLEFREGYSVVKGDEPDTWRLEDLLATLTIKRSGADVPSIAPLCVTLYVRKTTGENAGYEVYREVFFEGAGCVGK